MPRVFFPRSSVAMGRSNAGSRRPRLIGRGAIAIILGLLVLGVAGILALRQAAVAETQADLRRLAVIFAEQTARAVQAADMGLQSILEEIRLEGGSTDERLAALVQGIAYHERLIRHTEHLPQVEAYSVIGGDGWALNTSRIWPVPAIRLEDRSYFRHFATGDATGSFVSEPVHNRVNGDRTVYLSRRISGPDGEFMGIVTCAIRLRYFDEVFEAARLADGTSVTLVRADGTVLSRAPGEPGAPGLRFQTPGWHAAAEAGGGAIRIATTPLDARGPRHIHIHKVADFPLLVSIARMETAALARWRGQALGIGMLVALAVALIAALAVVLIRHERAMHDAHLMVVAHAAEMQAGREKLAETTAVLRVTLENIAQGIIMVDGQGRVAMANRRAGELLGLPPGLLGGQPLFADLARHQRESGEHDGLDETVRAMVDRDEVPEHPLVYERRRPNGTTIEVNSIPLPGGGMVRTYTDITARAEAEAMLAQAASHDHLTGLANRNCFGQRLDRALQAAARGGSPFAVLCLDLDGFKSVNDSFGHEVGDGLLQQVSRRMRDTLREGDMLARMGGDEFAALLPGVDGAIAARVAQRLLQSVGQPFEVAGHEVQVGVSIGIVVWPLDGATAEELLRHADAALYQAKAAGKNRWRAHAAELGDREHLRHALEQEMREALAQRQFSLAYQPICEAESGSPVAFEALLRWTHPTRGALPPGEFIPLAEQTGLILPLGRWALEAACAEAAAWAVPARVAVNVSLAQIRAPDFLAVVQGALAHAGLPGHRLDLELTEGLLLEEGEALLEVMQALRGMGVRLVLDDFGATDSNLSHLRGLPFDAVKIDRSFMRALNSDRQARALVTAIMAMAHAIDLQVVGKGVETAEQLAMLRHLRCDLVQGYLLGRPMPGETAREWLWKMAGRRSEMVVPADQATG